MEGSREEGSGEAGKEGRRRVREGGEREARREGGRNEEKGRKDRKKGVKVKNKDRKKESKSRQMYKIYQDKDANTSPPHLLSLLSLASRISPQL